MNVSIVIPALDEEHALPLLAARLRTLEPAPCEIVLVDGGSADRTRELAADFGWRVLTSPQGRGLQINRGVEAAAGEAVMVLHADTMPPADAIAVVSRTLADSKVALASFTPLIRGPEKTRWLTSAHNWAKTWYAPAIFRPHLFLKGVRLLFGDHAMFFRRADFLRVGGCDPAAKVLEEADLCIAMARLGRVRMVPRLVETSDRRIARWGGLKANWIYLKIGVLWALGSRKRLERHYPHVR